MTAFWPPSVPTPPRPKPAVDTTDRSTAVDPDSVVGHDGKVYRALTVERMDLHLRDVSERIQRVRGDVKELYRDDLDRLLDRRSYLSLCPTDG